MADVTLLREAHRNMIRIIGVLKICEVAAYASRAGQSVISIRMALTALQRRMEAGERPSGGRMIKFRGGPIRRAVAYLTLLRESRRNVIGIIRTLEILQVATNACCGAEVEVPIDMAQGALHLNVGPG